MQPSTKIILLNSFDRTGSSAISRTLAEHPDIELIFQPFNSGSIRKKMYQILTEENASQSDHHFFRQLVNHKLDESYIKSQWHYKYSTVHSIQPGKIHIIKTTLNHFTAAWMVKHFPSIELWGIWREPIAILCSIMRNDVFEDWYADAKEQIIPTVRTTPLLNDVFAEFIPELNNPTKISAFLISVRSYYYFHYLQIDRIFRYENFLSRPNQLLNNFTSVQGLTEFDFSPYTNNDLNVSGKSFQRGANYQDILDQEDIVFAERLFKPLRRMMQEKFTDGTGINDLRFRAKLIG